MTKLRVKIVQIELEFSEQYYDLDKVTEKMIMQKLKEHNICNSDNTYAKGKILMSGIMEYDV